MGLPELREALLSNNDDPLAILNALATPWRGSLSSKRYEDLLVYCLTAKPEKAKPKQLEMLVTLGADLGRVHRLLEREKAPSAPRQSDFADGEEFLIARRAFDRYQRGGSQEGATIRQFERSLLVKFLGQLMNDKSVDGASNKQRVGFKGKLIAHLETTNACSRLMPSMKRSLIADARAECAGGHTPDSLEKALTPLKAEENDFYWCSLTGAKGHAIDTVMRKLATGGYELTSCNRGSGAEMSRSRQWKKVEAMRAEFNSAKDLATALSKFTKKSCEEPVVIYNAALHPRDSSLDKLETGRGSVPINRAYRPQKPQKEGNCATKSMFAALNLLMATSQEGLGAYKAVKGSLRDQLQGSLPLIGG